MRRRLRLAGALILVTAVSGASLVSAAVGQLDGAADVSDRATRVDPPPVADLTPEQRAAFEMVELVNAERSRRGLPIFRWHDQVGAAAQAHAADMAANGRIQHAGTDGSNAGDRLRRAGFGWSAWGENVAAGFTTAAPLLEGWMNSPSHRPHLLGNLTYVGVGAVASSDGTPYWALVVAS